MSLSSSSTLPLIAECSSLTVKNKCRLVKPMMEKRCRVWLNHSINSLKDLVETNIESSNWKKLASWK